MKYVVKPVAYNEDASDLVWVDSGGSMDVIEEDDGPIPTGVLDSLGRELYRVAKRQPIGFRGK